MGNLQKAIVNRLNERLISVDRWPTISRSMTVVKATKAVRLGPIMIDVSLSSSAADVDELEATTGQPHKRRASAAWGSV